MAVGRGVMKTYDLIVLGAGSGNNLLGAELDHLRTAIVEPGRFGGTCLNRGCIPSKMLVVAADAARAAGDAQRLGCTRRWTGSTGPRSAPGCSGASTPSTAVPSSIDARAGSTSTPSRHGSSRPACSRLAANN